MCVVGEGTPIFSYIHMAWTIFFLVQNFDIQNVFVFFFGGGGVQKNEQFWGYEEILDIFESSLHYWTNLGGGGIFIHLRQGTEWESFLRS